MLVNELSGLVLNADREIAEDYVMVHTNRSREDAAALVGLMSTLNADALMQAVRQTQSRARTRVLDRSDVEAFCELVLHGIERLLSTSIPLTALEVEIHGGGVPNSYKYRAETTSIQIDSGKVRVRRTDARSGSHGAVANHYARVRGDSGETTAACKAAGLTASGGYFHL